MAPAFVFGYGSLLDGATGVPCRLSGWRRRFGVAMDNRRTIAGYKYFLDARTGARPELFVAFLDVVPEPGAAVQGIAAAVDAEQLSALDDRERNYARVDVSAALDREFGGPVWAYAGRPEARERYAAAVATGRAVVARAYVEDVRAGFAAHGLTFDTLLEVPVMDLERVDVS
jgi:cation transport regulator ChaC